MRIFSFGRFREAARSIGLGEVSFAPAPAASDDPSSTLYVWSGSRPAAAADDEPIVYIGIGKTAARTRNEMRWARGAGLAGGRTFQVADSRAGRRLAVASPIVALLDGEERLFRVDFERSRPSDETGWSLVDLSRAVLDGTISRVAADLVRSLEERGEPVLAQFWGASSLELRPGAEDLLGPIERWLRDDLTRDGWLAEGVDDPPRLSVPELEKFFIRVAVRSGALIGNSQFAGQWESLVHTREDTLAAIAVAGSPSVGSR